ncbi:GGDEF domain-containing protein [Rubrivivax gelatinosus]|uniref:diguanylate cyclase n=1 Tax=Rubrivivax gelatinosus TaxID=28068 RepID=A0A4R2M505_RUBGE|nr:GGDEF domain-containing protein [Rubrivivax gelatinosus]MBK1689578.1 GGDEF domain-containing protein [Rubrivivax gelatinosus]TCP01250.1 diguanylate cyclase (GGDEF)-like protein [Rubrivivax gelatinosus]
MTLHEPTIFVLLLIGYAMLGLLLVTAGRRLVSGESLRRWGWGNGLMLAGYLFLLVDVAAPWPGWIAASNALIVYGEFVFVTALQRFIDERLPSGPLRWGGVAAALSMLPLMLLPTPTRMPIQSLIAALPLLWAGWLVWRSRARAERALRPVGLMLVLVAVALLIRTVHALLQPAAYVDLSQPNPVQTLLALAAYAALLGSGFGFVLACTERATRSLERQASHDGLTGALNRQAGGPLLQRTLLRARRERQGVAYVLLDLDRFKQVNDEHGHAFGDEVLRRFARTVRTRMRASDLFVRLGGEEFALVLPDSDAAGALVVLEHLRRDCLEMGLCTESGCACRVSFSAGIALSPQGRVDGDALYRAADTALYRAKRAGRDQVALAGADETIHP